MLANLGQSIRQLRKEKGISLNEFAERLEVSPGYLSNLETGKTDTISLTLLSELNEMLCLIPVDLDPNLPPHELDFRLNRMCLLLKNLYDTNQQLAEFFISHIETGISLIQK